MSTCFRFIKPVRFARIKRLKITGISVELDTEDEWHCLLTDGKNFLHVSTGDGSDVVLTRYGRNDVWPMLERLAQKFGPILSEHEEEFFCDDREEQARHDAVRGAITLYLDGLVAKPPTNT